jgi:hypothetical protein
MGLSLSNDPDPKDLRQQNDEVLQALSHWHDRAFGFVYLNPNHVEASLIELDRCVRDGPMVGVKLWVARRCDDEHVDTLVARAAEARITANAMPARKERMQARWDPSRRKRPKGRDLQAWLASWDEVQQVYDKPRETELAWQVAVLHHVFGNPFRRLPPRPESIIPLVERIYAGEWNLMPLLGEWLQEHGYWDEGEHCLDPNVHHVKGCWVVDWVTGRE